MSSEAITRNDLTAILNDVLPPTPSEYKKLLWENTQGAQSSYSFTANFSEYDELEVVFNRNGGLYTFTCGTSGSASFVFPYNDYLVQRTATISGNTFTFGNGSAYTSYNIGGGGTVNYSYAVPLKVYGIKYERVNPPQVEIADYVVEQGTSGIWTYRKWNSGIAECWGVTASSDITTSAVFGSLYYINVEPIATFPSGLFVATPCVTATRNESGSGFGLLSLYAITSTSFSGYVINGLNQTVAMSFAIYAFGKWK